MSTNQVVSGSIVLNDVHDGTHLVIGIYWLWYNSYRVTQLFFHCTYEMQWYLMIAM